MFSYKQCIATLKLSSFPCLSRHKFNVLVLSVSDFFSACYRSTVFLPSWKKVDRQLKRHLLIANLSREGCGVVINSLVAEQRMLFRILHARDAWISNWFIFFYLE